MKVMSVLQPDLIAQLLVVILLDVHFISLNVHIIRQEIIGNCYKGLDSCFVLL